jgi:hypothetical protein
MPGEPKPEHGMPPRRRSPPSLVGEREMIELARKDGPSLVMAVQPLWYRARAPLNPGKCVKLPLSAAA